MDERHHSGSSYSPLPSLPELADEERGSFVSGSDGRRSSSASDAPRFSSEGECRPRLRRAVPRIDSLDVESVLLAGLPHLPAKEQTFAYAMYMVFQTIGLVYSDMGTSPLYVYSSAFNGFEIEGAPDILGAVSIVIYTITLIPLIKYVLVVLRANDREDDLKGGSFSLYSLICQYAKVNLIPNRQQADDELSNFKIQLPSQRLARALRMKERLEKNIYLKTALLVMALLGVSLVISNGILTPCISVTSAVSGLRVAIPSLSEVALLVVLFSIQGFGTGKVALVFAPVMCLWFAAIAAIGISNIIKYDSAIFKAFNPMYIYRFFRRRRGKAWHALGGLALCITGGEVMFADFGDLPAQSIQISFSLLVYPCLLLSYMGQAAYLLDNPQGANNVFFNSIPGALFWPMFLLAISAAMIASRSIILATFSVIKMALALDCFPRVKILHTSKRLMGQIYIPVVNVFLMIMCVVVTACLRSTYRIGHAYCVAVLGDMLVTTAFITLIMIMIWQTSLLAALGFMLVIGAVEFVYLAAVLLEVHQGGWMPLASSVIVLIIMYIWHYGTRMKYQSEVDQRISIDYMLELGANLGTVRVPGVGLLYNELVRGVPAIFGYFMKSLPAMHSTIIFVCIKYVPVPVVPQSERFLFRRVCPRDYHLFRCVARYGYKDVRKENHYIFEQLLLQSLEAFIQKEAQEYALECDSIGMESDDSEKDFEPSADVLSSRPPSLGPLTLPLLSSDVLQGLDSMIDRSAGSSFSDLPSGAPSSINLDDNAVMELAAVRDAKESGVVYLLGHADVRAKKQSWFVKKLVINYFYAFLSRNCRATGEILSVPHTHLMEVGMTYMV
ncbi:hypothetical protein GOP47_0018945 [Adiantum capillus-veneris]|uniref:Potassium transporter n=1 Tax=Adiantum capillus-veneris TaxID=13818 RepID=A0A9D4UE71_ADICA|nr:hypothetical protein GOP47_0018945 [Adiantum capillus-veneris]